MSEIIEIDGGTLEGGGQILRMSLAFSVLLKKPIKIFNIRAGRSSPGLRPQHLAGVKLVHDLCQGRLEGDAVGSTEIIFYPNEVRGGKYMADPGTAGSVMLLFQVSFPCLLFADSPSELILKGGTNAEMAPQIDHTLMVFKPIIEKMGALFSCNIIRRGYYPKGGGEIHLKIQPLGNSLKPIECFNPGTLTEIKGRSFVAGVLPIKMAHGMADAACQYIRIQCPSAPLKIERIVEPRNQAVGNGSGIIIVGKTDTGYLLGGSALGKRGVTNEEVGEKAAKEFVENITSKASVDQYVQDQLIIFMALAKGKSRIQVGTLTMHTKTAIFVAELMTKAKFTVLQNETETSNIIECEGIGLSS